MSIDGVAGGSDGDILGIWDYEQGNAEEVSLAEPGPTFSQSQLGVRDQLSKRIKQNQVDPFTYSLVDDVVRVKTLSAEKREEKVGYWKTRRMERLTIGGLSVAGLVMSGVNAANAANPLWWAALAAGTLASTIFGFYTASKAHDQVSKWNQDLPVVIANQRQVGFKEGMLYMMRHDAKADSDKRPYSSIISTAEMQGLYHEFFHQFSEGFADAVTDRNKVAYVKAAAHHSPLSAYVMGFGKLFPLQKDAISFYAEEFVKFLHAFNTVQSRRHEHISEVRASANSEIRSIEREKEQARSLVYATYSLYRSKAEQDRAKALQVREEGVTVEAHAQEVERKFQDSLRQARQLRDLGLAMVSLPFDRRIRDVEQKRKEYLEEIRANFDAKLLPLFSHLGCLHKDAYLTFIGQGPQIYPHLQDPNEFFEFQPPVFAQPKPSAPSYEEVFGHIREEQEVDPRVYEDFMGAYHHQYDRGRAG